MGLQMRQLLATLCVASSLTLGSFDPTSRFHLLTLSFGKPIGNHGARLGYNFCISCYHSWCNVQGLGEACKHSLPSLLLRLRGPSCFSSSIVTPWGY
jgi:hypothetical protein